MSSKHLLLLILSLVVLAAPALADYAKPTALGKRKRPPHSPPLHGKPPPPPLASPQGPEALAPELLEKLFPGRHYHGFMLHHRPGPQGPELINRLIRGRHSPPPHGKPTPPPHWDPPPFNMTPPPPPPPPSPSPPPPSHEPGSLGPTPEPLEKLFPGRHYHGFMLHHRPGPQGPELFKRPIRARHNPPPHGKPTAPPHWDPPPFNMTPPPPPPSPSPPPPSHEPGSLGPAIEPSEKLFPGRRRRLLAHASFANHGHHPVHLPVLHHGSHQGTHLPMECGKGLPVIPTKFNI